MSTPTYNSPPVGAGGRVTLTLLGAFGLILGAFAHWTRGTAGVDLPWHNLADPEMPTPGSTVQSLGAWAIIAALVGLFGLSEATGQLTRTAGAAAIVGLILFLVTVLRSPYHSIGAGVWLTGAGALLFVVAGLKAVPRMRKPE